MHRLVSIPNVVHVERLRGVQNPSGSRPDLLVEVPHGADERSHYDALRDRLEGALPQDLHRFFHINTDVGAWAYGKAAAQHLIERDPRRSALLVRSLIPRTFVDCNRNAADRGGSLGAGQLTPGTPPYVRAPNDLALLSDLHQQYVDTARSAFAEVCGHGGVALVPHTYGPRTLGIDAIDEQIVDKLQWACAPEREQTWPLRAEIDLLTRDGDGKLLAPPTSEADLQAAFAAVGLTAVANETYHLHPSALGHTWSSMYPGRVLTLEIRRDLLVDAWRPFEEMRALPERVAPIAQVLGVFLGRVLEGQ